MLAAQISSNTELVYGRWDDEPVTSPSKDPAEIDPAGRA
jgi:TatD DNase family protein